MKGELVFFVNEALCFLNSGEWISTIFPGSFPTIQPSPLVWRMRMLNNVVLVQLFRLWVDVNPHFLCPLPLHTQSLTGKDFHILVALELFDQMRELCILPC